MKKYKNTILLILTWAALIVCGMLPVITAVIEDKLADDKIYYGEIKQVRLFQELNDTERLYLLKNGTKAEVTEDRAKLKEANMLENVEAALDIYRDGGLISAAISDFTMTCKPYLYYSTEISNLSGIFWEIEMELWDEYGQSMTIYLDDQTGKALLISYECLEPVFESYWLDQMVNVLYKSYRSVMDFAEEHVGQELRDENGGYTGKYSISYQYADMIYGEMNIDFVVTETGFSIYLT